MKKFQIATNQHPLSIDSLIDFFIDTDTTYCRVNFVGGEEAKAIKLISTQDDGIAVLGVDDLFATRPK